MANQMLKIEIQDDLKEIGGFSLKVSEPKTWMQLHDELIAEQAKNLLLCREMVELKKELESYKEVIDSLEIKRPDVF